MKILVVINDEPLRDQIAVGLEAFESFQVDFAVGAAAVEQCRMVDYDAVVLGVEPTQEDTTDLFDRLRQGRPELEFILVAEREMVARIKEDQERVRGRIFAFLGVPLEPIEFFRSMGRLRRGHQVAS